MTEIGLAFRLVLITILFSVLPLTDNFVLFFPRFFAEHTLAVLAPWMRSNVYPALSLLAIIYWSTPKSSLDLVRIRAKPCIGGCCSDYLELVRQGKDIPTNFRCCKVELNAQITDFLTELGQITSGPKHRAPRRSNKPANVDWLAGRTNFRPVRCAQGVCRPGPAEPDLLSCRPGADDPLEGFSQQSGGGRRRRLAGNTACPRSCQDEASLSDARKLTDDRGTPDAEVAQHL